MKIALLAQILASFLFVSIFAFPSIGLADISGGTGNSQLQLQGVPEGAAKVFNWPTRVAWWEGPPFGGGQYHAESKGDTAEVNKVLEAFSKIKSKKRRVIIKSGIGYSFWLDPNQKKRGDRSTKIDWEFTVWVLASWKFQKTLPTGMSAVEGTEDEEPVPTLTIYTASLDWAKLKIPKGIDVDDQTLEAHGFEKSDGRVLQGFVADSKTNEPIQADIQLERVKPNPKGGYLYTAAESTQTNAQGEWTITNVEDAWSRIVVKAQGYAPRVAKYVRYDKQPGWEFVEAKLAKAAAVSGIVVDEAGKPMEGVRVRARQLRADESGQYRLPIDARVLTPADGTFKLEGLPTGSANVSAYKAGYNGPSLGMEIQIPDASLKVRVTKAAYLDVEVVFPNGREAGKQYIVEIEDARGAKPGSWGGSSMIDDKNKVRFSNVTPGKYIVTGRPNPGNGNEFKVNVELVGGETKKIQVEAK